MNKKFEVYNFKKLGYDEAHSLQLQLVEKMMYGDRDKSYLLLLEHPHIFTIGKYGRLENVLKDVDTLSEENIQVRRIERGGDVTYHGPGQIVGYPIMYLPWFKKSIREYFWAIEEVMINALDDFGIASDRIEKYPGVWVGNRKIASIGVALKRWITYHGFALNVNTDLKYFDYIIPCGIKNAAVTSIEEILGLEVNIEKVKTSLISHFIDVFGLEKNEVS